MSIEFLLTSLVVVLIPGTGVLYTVATGLFAGRRASLSAAVGCTLGITPALLACVLGLSALFHTSALAFQLVKYAGAAYLLYLAWMMWRSASPLSLGDRPTETNHFSIVLKGFLLNILNPKLSIFFLAFLPQFVAPGAQHPLTEMLGLGVIFMLMTLIVFIAYGFAASAISSYATGSQSITTAIQKLFAGSFAILGIKLALSDRT